MYQEGSFRLHEDMYLPNGDIVLRTNTDFGDEDDAVLFRVDSVYLSRQSPVFRSMLPSSSKTKAKETYDGVRVVRMSDDWYELGQLLSAMYDIKCV